MLHFMVRFYDDAILCLYLFEIRIVYIIISRHVYQDMRALHGQLAMYVLKHFICQCLLYIEITQRDTVNFYITMIIPVQLHKLT